MTATFVIGWTLVHFLWQGALVAAACAALLAVAGDRSPSVRYGLSAAAMVVMALLPVWTAMRLSAAPGNAAASPPAGLIDTQVEGLAGDVAAPAPVPAVRTQVPATRGPAGAWLANRLERMMPWLVGLWLAGVLALSLRLLGGWVWARRLTRVGVGPAAEELQAMLSSLATRLRITRPVRLLQSSLVYVPAVIGWLRPALLFPVSLASGLTLQQVEVLLAHELAHVRRHDYAVNLLQAVIETLLFYHPAVWWVSRRIREEREHCCDDLAVAVTGNPRAYAGALLELEKLRAGDLGLAAAATGGSLVRRIRRMLSAPRAQAEYGQRWLAGAFVVATTLLVAGGSQLSSAAAIDVTGAAIQKTQRPQGSAQPDTVIAIPDDGALSARWSTAQETARRAGFDRFWLGYVVEGGGTDHWLYFDRYAPVFAGEGTIMSGHLRFSGRMEGISTGGVRLEPLFGARAPDDLVILLSFTVASGRAALDRVHLSSFIIPVHFGGQPVLWLGEASDAESVELARGYYDRATSPDLRKDLVSVVGAHADSRVVVPHLSAWLAGSEPDEIRVDAAEWLGHHADPASLAALARAARSDRSSRVRAEAAESVGDVALLAAADTLIALARTLSDRAARLEAVEALGEREEPQALDALVTIIRDDPSVDVKREAVETLGDRPDAGGVPHLTQIAQSHPQRDVRYEALETIAHAAPPDQAVALLGQVARQDRSVEVQRAAVEALGDIDDERAWRLLIEIAQQHPVAEVRVEAVETLGHAAAPGQAFDVLARIARDDPQPGVQLEAVETLGELEDQRVVPALDALVREHARLDVQVEAIETLGELHDRDAAVLERVAEFARSHPRVEVRLEAVETYAEHAEGEAAIRFLISLAQTADRREVRFEALESLVEVHDGGVDAIIEIARSTSDRETLLKAIEVLGDSDDPRAISVLEGLIRQPR